MRLYHYSRFADLDKKGICPRYHGQGIKGAESKRKNMRYWVDRSYYGTSDYEPETGLGTIAYSIDIDESKIYDICEDKHGIVNSWDTINSWETNIAIYGYDGYVNKKTYPEIVAIFKVKIPVRITPEIKTKARW